MEEKGLMEEGKCMSRKEKRKAMKKMKRKQTRKEAAERERREEEERLNNPEEQRRMQLLEQQEAERMQRDRILFQEREKAWMDTVIARKQQQQQQQREEDEDDEYEYVEEEGPPEIIWRGNEIIFKKKQLKVRVTDRDKPEPKPKPKPKPNETNQNDHQEEDNRPTSNPLPPESTLENVAQQIPNFGTEQDKAHCPFHLKTGACRFGIRCSRVHFYPDKSSTLLIKNMYNGPGLACDRDQDEGLEYTDEEVERCFEEFYEDVHTEFLKFGEIVNFKVCKNGSFHLRGNVYVQYKSLDSALLAYNSVNGRYFAGKQVSCQFVNLTRWKVAICGEYMKSGFKTCSHGTACNFIHCFRNPGGDYEWADSDKPPPKFWVKKMIALFGFSDDYETSREQGNLSLTKTDSDRKYHSRRSRSREMDQLSCGHSGRRRQQDERKRGTPDEDWNADFKNNHKGKSRGRTPDSDSDREWLEEKEENRERHHEYTMGSSFNRNRDDNSRSHEEDSDVDWDNRDNEKQHGREGRNSRKRNRDEKRHHISKSKRSRHHQGGDASESDKYLLGRGEMETQHDYDYSRKTSRHRSGLPDDYKYYENENDKVDGGWSRKDSYKHKKKRSKH